MNQKQLKIRLGQFGRSLALMFNRAMMYEKSHPVVQQSVEEVQKAAETLLDELSPLVFILNRDLFFIDEEALDPRINVARIVNWFKTNGIQSISFVKGVTQKELVFLAGFFSTGSASGAEEIKASFENQGIFHIKINHIIYKKVSEDDQVISREALKKATPLMAADDADSRRRFMETLMESVLTEEFAKTLNINSLIANPGNVSKNMIAADLAGAESVNGKANGSGDGSGAGGSGSGTGDTGSGTGASQGQGQGDGIGGGGAGGSGSTGSAGTGPGPGGSAGNGTPGSGGGAKGSGTGVSAGAGGANGDATGSRGHGQLLLHQIEVMHQEVVKHIQGQGDVQLSDLAAAVFDMKKQLLEGIQAQKALGIAYANESDIRNQADELTDQVLLELVREEYQAGRITTTRLAYLIKRLVPEPDDLRRLMPKIKTVLIEEGMTLDEYLILLQELGNELQSDDLVRVLHENFEAIGVDGDQLIGDIKNDPELAAKLMYMASEIRKGGGSEEEFTETIVGYIEKMTGQAMEASEEDGLRSEQQIKEMVTGIESDILQQLGRLNVNNDALSKMEKRLNDRMDAILDNMRVEWLESQQSQKSTSSISSEEKLQPLTVLQTLEQNVKGDDDLKKILEAIRRKADKGAIEENNFSQIQSEIARLKEKLESKASSGIAGGDILNSDELLFFLEKEIARTKRYESVFCVLGLSLVSIKPISADKNQSVGKERQVSMDAVIESMLDFFVSYFREVDIIGQIGKNKFMILLPNIDQENGKKALGRILRQLHVCPLSVDGIDVELRVAGVVTGYNPQVTPDAAAFAKFMVNQLTEMVTRVKNIQVLF